MSSAVADERTASSASGLTASRGGRRRDGGAHLGGERDGEERLVDTPSLGVEGVAGLDVSELVEERGEIRVRGDGAVGLGGHHGGGRDLEPLGEEAIEPGALAADEGPLGAAAVEADREPADRHPDPPGRSGWPSSRGSAAASRSDPSSDARYVATARSATRARGSPLSWERAASQRTRSARSVIVGRPTTRRTARTTPISPSAAKQANRSP